MFLWSLPAQNLGRKFGVGHVLPEGRNLQEEEGTTEDQIVAWHHRLDGLEFEQAPGVSDRKAWHAAGYGVTKSRA